MTQLEKAPEAHPTMRLPFRLHHNAFPTADQEKTRAFYEEVIGLPLVAAWTEVEEFNDMRLRFCHTFFEMADGGALAFFQFADKEYQDQFGPDLPASPFRHIALATDAEMQAAIRDRIADAGIVEPQTFERDHGYCYSLYVTDPNGLLLEFTVDAPDSAAINKIRRESAHADLARWLGGDYSSNNKVRN
jgi:catechol 2,3-dioxygenase-like lactoylglutathione lyase family enzyme